MKIIKVIHCIDDGDLEFEKQLLTLKDYDVESFMKPFIEELSDYLFVPFTDKVELNGFFSKFIAKSLLKTDNIDPKIKQKLFSVCILGYSKQMVKDISDKLTNVEILSIEEAKNRYPKTHNLSIGTYTLHPYNSKMLTKLEHYHKNLALDKDNELFVLLGRMGAKSLRTIVVDSNTKIKAGKVGGNAETVFINTGADVSISSKLSTERELLVVYEGNSVEISDDLLERSIWFANDSQLNGIFESRRFNPNKMKEFTLKYTYTDTFDFDFNLAGKYTVVNCDLLAEYHSISSKEHLFEVKFS